MGKLIDNIGWFGQTKTLFQCIKSSKTLKWLLVNNK